MDSLNNISQSTISSTQSSSIGESAPAVGVIQGHDAKSIATNGNNPGEEISQQTTAQDKLFFIKRMPSSEVSFKDRIFRNYVKIDDGSGPVSVKISHLRDRLLFSKQDIKDIKSGKINNLEAIVSKSESSSTKMVEHMQSFKQIYNLEGKKLFDKEGNPVQMRGLEKTADLFKLIAATSQTLQEAGSDTAVVSHEKMQVLAKLEDKKLSIIDLTNATKLGDGSFGVAFKVFNVTAGRFDAMKLARASDKDSFNELARADNKNETEMLRNVRGSRSGVMGFETVNRDIQNTEIRGVLKNGVMVGFVGKLYDGDLYNRLEKGGLPLEKRIDAIKQLLTGLSTLLDQGILHEDLKPENIFRKDETNTYDICDLGGCRRLDAPDFSTSLGTHTPSYVHFADMKKSNEISDRIDVKKNEIQKLKSELTRLESNVASYEKMVKSGSKTMETDLNAAKSKLEEAKSKLETETNNLNKLINDSKAHLIKISIAEMGVVALEVLFGSLDVFGDNLRTNAGYLKAEQVYHKGTEKASPIVQSIQKLFKGKIPEELKSLILTLLSMSNPNPANRPDANKLKEELAKLYPQS